MRIFLIIFLALFYVVPAEATLVYNSNEDKIDNIQVFKASAQVFEEFFSNLEKKHAPVQYMREANMKIRSVIFKKLPEDTYGAYNPVLDTMYFPLEMQDGTSGRLLPFAKLSDSKLGTIYHEMWHAYLDLVATPTQSEIFRYFQSQSQSIYSSHGRDFHDEAYGMFINDILIDYMQLWNIFAKATPEVREKYRSSQSLAKIYDEGFHGQIFGYYYSPLLRKFINSTVNLPESDRQKIVALVLKDRPPYDYQEAFAEILFAE